MSKLISVLYITFVISAIPIQNVFSEENDEAIRTIFVEISSEKTINSNNIILIKLGRGSYRAKKTNDDHIWKIDKTRGRPWFFNQVKEKISLKIKGYEVCLNTDEGDVYLNDAYIQEEEEGLNTGYFEFYVNKVWRIRVTSEPENVTVKPTKISLPCSKNKSPIKDNTQFPYKTPYFIQQELELELSHPSFTGKAYKFPIEEKSISNNGKIHFHAREDIISYLYKASNQKKTNEYLESMVKMRIDNALRINKITFELE